jgi:endonuclease/exonuclease/phosphatase family metal-dependent hydrolase
MNASSLSIMVLTIIVVAIVSIAGNIGIDAILPTSVSAFVTIPLRQQHHVASSSAVEGCYFSSRVTTILAVTRTAEETPAPVVETEDGSKATSSPVEDDITESTTKDLLKIVPPNEGFRNTKASGGTEVSIASMNLLAPFYNSLGLNQKTTTDYERWEFLNNDRTQRVPKAIQMAKRTNADVLCLQEIEGGKLGEAGASEGQEFTLRDDIREWLAESTTTMEGYDSFVWSPLNPNNKRGDMVGLCIAWRSKKHSLVEWEGYKRGMVCMLREADSSDNDNNNNKEQQPTASFAIANLHLPARPSNVLGRLKTMSRTIRKLSDLDRAMKLDRPKHSANTIDGLIVVAGDFNSDQDSVAARLLSHGYMNYGNVRDRNYKAKVTKASATDMSHPYRFIDSYDHGTEYGSGSSSSSSNTDPRFRDGSFRDLYAPVTVSLKGRGPGIMDHLFYATGTKKGKHHQKPVAAARRTNPSQVAMQSSADSTKDALSTSLLTDHLSKRSKRRKKGETRGGGGSEGMASAAHYSNNSEGARIRVEAVLATVDPQTTSASEKRLKIIHEGLPNLEEGFPSDHLPVGVLFSATNVKSKGDTQVTGIDLADINTDDDASSSSKITEEETAAMDQNLPSTRLSEGEKIPEEDPSPTDSAPNQDSETTATSAATAAAAAATADLPRNNNRPSGVSSSVRRRRNSSRTSFGLRRRHNLVLNAMTEWLVGRGATSVVLDKPLYKNDLLERTLGAKEVKKNLTKKSRAPDLMCVFVDAHGDECVVVVEVAVASDPDKVRAVKTSKYKDLVDLLSKSNKSCRLATIVVGDDGDMPEGTRSDIQWLAQLTSGSNGNQEESEAETNRLCEHLGSLVSCFQVQ